MKGSGKNSQEVAGAGHEEEVSKTAAKCDPILETQTKGKETYQKAGATVRFASGDTIL